jgi:hypothetical protein
MPKCPACVAAHVALLTGVSVSTVLAGQVRMIAIIICISLLVCCTLTALRRVQRRRN